MPFLQEELVGKGAIGTAFKVELYPQCHQLPLEGNIVRERDGGFGFVNPYF